MFSLRISELPTELPKLSKADKRAYDCPLSAYQGDPGQCRWCASELPRTKKGKINHSRRWCGQDCALAFTQQHSWNEAKHAVKSRDGFACRHCGTIGWAQIEDPYLNIVFEPKIYPAAMRLRQWMNYLEVDRVDDIPTSILELCNSEARYNGISDRKRSLKDYLPEIQVHHIIPRNGGNHSNSCLNHHDNLVCLCHSCHTVASQYQQWARRYGYSDIIGLRELSALLL